jgi:hypothetical protein
MLIDCETCTVRGAACPDCVVSVLLHPPSDAVNPLDLDESEQNAVSVLAASGLLPALRLVVASSAAEDRPPDRHRETA